MEEEEEDEEQARRVWAVVAGEGFEDSHLGRVSGGFSASLSYSFSLSVIRPRRG